MAERRVYIPRVREYQYKCVKDAIFAHSEHQGVYVELEEEWTEIQECDCHPGKWHVTAVTVVVSALNEGSVNDFAESFLIPLAVCASPSRWTLDRIKSVHWDRVHNHYNAERQARKDQRRRYGCY